MIKAITQWWPTQKLPLKSSESTSMMYFHIEKYFFLNLMNEALFQVFFLSQTVNQRLKTVFIISSGNDYVLLISLILQKNTILLFSHVSVIESSATNYQIQSSVRKMFLLIKVNWGLPSWNETQPFFGFRLITLSLFMPNTINYISLERSWSQLSNSEV